MATIQITVSGIDELVVDYDKFIFDMRNNMVVPLDEAAAKYLKVLSANFASRGALFNEPWPPLSEATIRDKRNLMKTGGAISTTPLVRTGALRSGFGRGISGLTKAFLYNTQKYALLHNEGGTSVYNGKRVNIPRRVLADVDTERINMVAAVFTDWFNKIIKKNRL
jgi:phage gpG-like protein